MHVRKHRATEDIVLEEVSEEKSKDVVCPSIDTCSAKQKQYVAVLNVIAGLKVQIKEQEAILQTISAEVAADLQNCPKKRLPFHIPQDQAVQYGRCEGLFLEARTRKELFNDRRLEEVTLHAVKTVAYERAWFDKFAEVEWLDFSKRVVAKMIEQRISKTSAAKIVPLLKKEPKEPKQPKAPKEPKVPKAPKEPKVAKKQKTALVAVPGSFAPSSFAVDMAEEEDDENVPRQLEESDDEDA